MRFDYLDITSATGNVPTRRVGDLRPYPDSPTAYPGQGRLDFTPTPRPVPPVRDQRVAKERRKVLGAKSQLILERIQKGPVSNAELALMFPPATAWRTRLSDVRFWLSAHGTRMGSHDAGYGLWWHWIEGER
jgi:hypothetical protein